MTAPFFLGAPRRVAQRVGSHVPISASTSSRVSSWEWAQTALLAANLTWTTLGRGGYPPAVMVVTSALVVALLAVHLGAQACGAASPRTHPAGWLLVPFVAYAAVNAAWVSPVPWLAWRDWFFWAEMVAVFWVVLNGIRSPAPQRVLFFTLVLLALVAVALAGYQRFVQPDWQMLGGVRSIYYRGRGSGPFGMPNSLAALLVLLLPAVAALTFRRGATEAQRVWWGWATLVLLVGLVLTISRGAWLALVVGIAAWPLCAGRGRWTRRIRLAAFVAVGIALVSASLYVTSPGFRARFQQLALDAGEKTRPVMWRAAWQLFAGHPVVGSGAGSYDVLFERHRPEGFWDEPLWAHNDYLNTLSDYGVIGFGLFFGAAGVIAVGVARRRSGENALRRDDFDSPMVLAGVATGLLAFALHLAVEFHLKIPALGLALATLGGIVVTRRWPAENDAHHAPRGLMLSRVSAASAAVASAGVYLIFFLPAFRAEALRKPARVALDALASEPADPQHYRAPLEGARAALTRATALDPANGQAWSDLAYATELWSHVERTRDAELGRVAEAAASRALACSPACHEFWIRRGTARDLQARWVEANNDFAKAVELAPHNANAWFYYADHLSRVPAARESAAAALAFCLRLDPWNQPGIALRQRLAIAPKVP